MAHNMSFVTSNPNGTIFEEKVAALAKEYFQDPAEAANLDIQDIYCILTGLRCCIDVLNAQTLNGVGMVNTCDMLVKYLQENLPLEGHQKIAMADVMEAHKANLELNQSRDATYTPASSPSLTDETGSSAGNSRLGASTPGDTSSNDGEIQDHDPSTSEDDGDEEMEGKRNAFECDICDKQFPSKWKLS